MLIKKKPPPKQSGEQVVTAAMLVLFSFGFVRIKIPPRSSSLRLLCYCHFPSTTLPPSSLFLSLLCCVLFVRITWRKLSEYKATCATAGR